MTKPTQKVTNEREYVLQKLYPTPLSYGRRDQQRATIKEKQLRERTKNGPLYIGISLSIALLFAIIVIHTTQRMVSVDVIAGFGAGLLLMILALGLILYVVTLIVGHSNIKGIRTGLFFTAYVICIAPHLYAWHVFDSLGDVNFPVLIPFTILHFVIVFILASVVYTDKLTESQKIMMLAGVMIASITAAFVISAGTPPVFTLPTDQSNQYSDSF